MKKNIQIQYHSFTGDHGLSDIEKKLLEKAKEARLKAYAPYSDFLVGCSVLMDSGEIYIGNNQENAAFPSGLCAERSVLYWISSNFPNSKIKKVFVIGGPREGDHKIPPIPPCGNCRQSMIEFETKQNEGIEIFFSNMHEEIIQVATVKDLLPFTFDSSFL